GVAQIEGDGAETQDQGGRQEEHRRDALEHRQRRDDRDQHAGHEGARRDQRAVKPAAAELVGREEDYQRPKIDDQPHWAMRLGWLGCRGCAHSGGRPAMALATSRGSNGRRSSTFSPTPIAWIGSPNFSAAATSTPPRAVPSSLVMMRPVTPALSRNTSTWARPFCPVVASKTSRTSCGASGLSRPSTRRIFASSSIKCDLFW